MHLNGKVAKQALQLLLIQHNARCHGRWPSEHVFFEAFMPQGKPCTYTYTYTTPLFCYGPC